MRLQKRKWTLESRIGSVKHEILLHINGDSKEIHYCNEQVKHDDIVDSLFSLINFLNGNPDNLKILS